ncbi:uncharacterized protein EV420DRAFT_1547480 [Desarmillaria tabescens]|uniref:Uncharacterized protein n=1 Tax=Armillaria tabescens TaxID=1929756 RepID=A0AA39N5A6_ARMTA|nr:uncharacterized protein EV420DRAFT_1547480 [Desarmillaria tabescens]KAK0457805.1 hypothetical protein EV420DRAFT_1547480 [Desarmillaria tabescens]
MGRRVTELALSIFITSGTPMKLADLRRWFIFVIFAVSTSAIPIFDSALHFRSDVSSIETTMTVQLDDGPKNENITQMNSDTTGSRWYYIAENWKLKDSDGNQTIRAILITNTNGRPLQQKEIEFFEEIKQSALEMDHEDGGDRWWTVLPDVSKNPEKPPISKIISDSKDDQDKCKNAVKQCLLLAGHALTQGPWLEANYLPGGAFFTPELTDVVLTPWSAEKQRENDFLIQYLRVVMMQYGTQSSRRASDDDDSGTSTSSGSQDSTSGGKITFNEDSLSEICKK